MREEQEEVVVIESVSLFNNDLEIEMMEEEEEMNEEEDNTIQYEDELDEGEEEDDEEGIESLEDDADDDDDDNTTMVGGGSVVNNGSHNNDDIHLQQHGWIYHGQAFFHNPKLREIGDLAVWSLSTAKPGNGVEQIRDGSCDTYWQSDGSHPHFINIQFARRAAISCLSLYMDYALDESYTPKKLCIRAGMTHHDLADIRSLELHEPQGWITIPLAAPPDPLDLLILQQQQQQQQQQQKTEQVKDITVTNRPLRVHFIQISIISMHQNGRDTHVRQVKVFGPRREEREKTLQHHYYYTLPDFETVELTQYACIR